MAIIEQIQDNTITKLRLTPEDDDAIKNIKQVITAIKENSSILTVHLVDDFLGCIRNSTRTEIIQALGNVPCLQEVRLEQGLIKVADIAELLCNVQGLKVLTVKDVVLQGSEEFFHAAEMALHSHRSIKEFSLDGSNPAKAGISLEKLELTGREQACAHGGIRAEPNPATARSA